MYLDNCQHFTPREIAYGRQKIIVLETVLDNPDCEVCVYGLIDFRGWNQRPVYPA